MKVLYAEIVGVLPQTNAPGQSRSERSRKIIVGPLAMGLEAFKTSFEAKTVIKDKGGATKNRHVVQFTVRPGPNKLPAGATAVLPGAALNLDWLPKDWLSTHKIEEVAPLSTNPIESELANATA